MIAHRGASGYRPEHTRSAYQLALDLGADAVEPDLVVSADGVLVVRHENELSTTTDIASRPEFADRRVTKSFGDHTLTGWFAEDLTWAELSRLRATERLPAMRRGNAIFDGTEGLLRFVDLLAMLDEHRDRTGRQVGAVAELKYTPYFAAIGLPIDELFAAEVTAAGWAGDPRLSVESFELSALRSLRARGIRCRSMYLVEAEGAPLDEPGGSYAESLTDDGLRELAGVVDGVSVPKALLLRVDAAGALTATDLVTRVHDAGLLAYCWTLRPENAYLHRAVRREGAKRDPGDWPIEFGVVIGTGVDGVFADHPDLALWAVRRAVGQPNPPAA